MAKHLFKTVGKVVGGSVGAVTVATSAGTGYLYYTDEKSKRLIDFSVKVTPMSCAYYSAILRTTPESEERKAEMEQLHKKYAPECLQICLELGGYYVKMGQMFCGMGFLPKPYEDEFQCLLDGVPPKPFAVIKRIVEDECGKALSDVYDSFEENAIAAASIGQVHCARLKDGTDVVVKVQYPEVERFFHMDVEVMKVSCKYIDFGISQQNLDQMFGEMTKSFEDEFDYRKEASNMKLVSRNILPYFGSRVRVPKPIDSLCTRKVLTMERLHGEPIKKRMGRLFEEMAQAQGKTRKQLEDDFKKQFEDPEQLQKLLNQRPPAEWQIQAYQCFLRAKDLMHNVPSWLYNVLVARFSGKPPQSYAWSALPLNGPAIMRLLFDVHAHQVFIDGAFNGDPHAGNVIVCDDGKVGLIDYGNLQIVPDLAKRKIFARFYLAMAKDYTERPETWNDSEIAQTITAAGAKVKHGNVKYLAATALTSYDMRVDAATMKRFGLKPDFSDLIEKMAALDELEAFPADLINLQRLCQTLVGVAGLIGAGQPSCSRMWRPTCELFLQRTDMSP